MCHDTAGTLQIHVINIIIKKEKITGTTVSSRGNLGAFSPEIFL